MELIHYKVPMKKFSDTHRFYFVGDAHYGNKAFDESLFLKTIDYISKDENGHVFLMGDMAECIMLSDDRYDPRSVIEECRNHIDDLAQFQCGVVGEMLEPIADKCICLMDGNHEDKLRQKYQIDFNWRLRDSLNKVGGNVRYGGDIAAVCLAFRSKHKSRNIVFLVSHGFGSGRTKGSKVNALMRMIDIMPGADGFFMAHHHDKVTDRVNCFDISFGNNDTLKLVEIKKLLGISGSFFKTYKEGQSNYASKKLYRPADLGAIYAEIQPWYGSNHLKSKMDVRDLIL